VSSQTTLKQVQEAMSLPFHPQRFRKSPKNELVGRGLARAEVIGTALAQQVFDIVDAIWLNDWRIEELTEKRSPSDGMRQPAERSPKPSMWTRWPLNIDE
jgi:hypothetical protein